MAESGGLGLITNQGYFWLSDIPRRVGLQSGRVPSVTGSGEHGEVITGRSSDTLMIILCAIWSDDGFNGLGGGG